MNAVFSEFHALSAFSFLRGSSRPEVMVARARELGLSSIAMTDHEGFYGSARAFHAGKEAGIRVVTGATLEWDGAHLPVLCASQHGYRTLSRHLTDRHLDGHRLLPACRHGDLIVLTGDREGPVIRHLLQDKKEAALEAIQALTATFGHGNVYVEIHRHSLRDDAKLNRYLIDLAKHLKLPLLASNAPLHARPDDRLLADAFTCLRHHTTLDAAGLLLAPNRERHLRGPQEMAALFRDLPEAVWNTQRLDERLDFTLEDLGYKFPNFHDDSGRPMSMEEQTQLLRHECEQGARERGDGRYHPKDREKIEQEIELIHELGFSGYFLIVQDLVRHARSEGILCQGRGSAANSMVCFSLGITNVNAVKENLVFDRFLSKDQTSWPDIDVDFPSGGQREKVIQYVFRKYGARGAAMTANVIRYRSRSAFREMSKVLGFPPSVAERFSAIGTTPGGPWQSSREKPEFTFEDRTASIIPPSHPRLPALEKLFSEVLDLPRHLGQHSGGMVIQDCGLDEVVPIQRATMPGRTVVQWDKDDCEDLGIVKIDLLGLGMLAAMENTLEICSRQGTPVELTKVPLDDPEVFAMLHKSDTIGTFQVESRAQMATLSIMQPQTFYEIAIQVAIVRPGPIVGGLVNPYLRRRRGDEEPDYIHPAFKETLGRTLGVPLFQEQILQMAMLIADFSGKEANYLRRAMAFNRSDERLQKVSVQLRERMVERGVEEEVQEKIIHAIGTFAEYGFPESHAISFAFLAYQSCWLKVHHAAAFYCGLINNYPMGFYSVNTLLMDAKHHGLEIRPACCVQSKRMTDVEDDGAIRLGLHRLKGISSGLLDRLMLEREKFAFAGLEDFLARVQPNQKERRILARSGALNELPELTHRRQALWQVELPLYGDLLDFSSSRREEVLPRMTVAEEVSADFAIQGATTGPHPMKLWREQHGREVNVVKACELPTYLHGMNIRAGGMVICRQRPGTAKGHCFISLEDETGITNLFVPQQTFQENRLVIVTEPFLLAEGYVQFSEGNQPTIYVTGISSLPGLQPEHTTGSHDFH
jgi:error-prone DNA polymerase